jgi:hypothetical protein
MDFRSYILDLFTIVSGLAVTDVAQRLARLIGVRRRIRWDWLPLVAAAVIICTVAVAWGRAWFSLDRTPVYSPSFLGFLMTLAAYLLLYITAAASLPVQIEEGLDLKAFYRDQCGEFWTLYAITNGQFLLRSFAWPALMHGGLPPMELVTCALASATFALAVSLVIWQDRRWHMIGAPLILAVIIGPNMLRPF